MDIEAKLRPLYLLQILQERTDEDNYLTVALGDKENEEHTLTLNVAGDANVNNLGAQELAVESSAVGGTTRAALLTRPRSSSAR